MAANGTPPTGPREAAQTYAELGWVTVPLPARDKRPQLPEWQRRRLSDVQPSEYTPSSNLGIILGAPSGHLVDVDLDCAEALAVAPLLLPSTGMVHGRASRPRSHYWYRAAVDQATRYISPVPQGGTLVELRGDKHGEGSLQTVVPPSVHPSGESIEWAAWPPRPTDVDPGQLQRAVAEVATSALLVRHHPGNGARHEFAMRLAGLLAYGGYPADRAERLVLAVSRAAGDLNQEDRRLCVRDTYARAARGEAVAGGPLLAQLMGEHGELVVRSVRRWLQLQVMMAPEATPLIAPLTTPAPGLPASELQAMHDFVDAYGVDLHYVPKWHRWFHWDGRTWTDDDQLIARELAMESARSRTIKMLDGSREALAAARTAESYRAIDAVTKLAAGHPRVKLSHDAFDHKPMLLNLQNGTLDVTTGELQPHTRTDLLTQLAPVAYDPDASAPQWERFLAEVLPDPAVRGFVQRFLGYCLSGRCDEQVMVFFLGAGANGKSTLLSTVQYVLGSYSCQAPGDLLVLRQHDGHPTELAKLHRVRLAVCQEIDAQARLNEVRVKQLTGGDIITARRMREDFWEFQPTHKLVVAANHRPQIRGTDEAIWRRIRLVPFDVIVPADQRDHQLPTKLREEAPGVLNWLLQGALEWQYGAGTAGDRLAAPDAVTQATASYRGEQDTLAQFLDERCTTHPRAQVSKTTLYEYYTDWCHSTGETPLQKNAFGRQMLTRGFEERRNGRQMVRFWLGVELAGAHADTTDTVSASIHKDAHV